MPVHQELYRNNIDKVVSNIDKLVNTIVINRADNMANSMAAAEISGDQGQNSTVMIFTPGILEISGESGTEPYRPAAAPGPGLCFQAAPGLLQYTTIVLPCIFLQDESPGGSGRKTPGTSACPDPLSFHIRSRVSYCHTFERGWQQPGIRLNSDL